MAVKYQRAGKYAQNAKVRQKLWETKTAPIATARAIQIQQPTTMLTFGEFDEYVSAILDINGFADTQELVDEAKN